MKYIVVDLEMDNIAREYEAERGICNREIIEIGAVVLNDEFQEIDHFKTYVRPQYNEKIEKHITKLTEITTEMVLDAPVFEVAITKFFEWCEDQQDKLEIAQWSESDLTQILQEMELKQVILDAQSQKLLVNWCDLQKECSDKLHLENAMSLKNATSLAGIEFEGKEHDALDDARNTAILMKILRVPELCKETLEKVIEALTPKEISTSLGDLFDFSAFALSA